MKYQLFFLLVLSLLSSECFGSSWYEVNNGGDTVVCHSDNNSPIPSGAYLLDYFETVYTYKLTPYQFSSASEDPRELARELILRFPDSWSGLDSVLRFVDTFFDQSRFVMEYALPNVPDTGEIVLPQNCILRQLVIQHCHKHQEGVCYSVDGEIWLRMSPEQQAATIVHEALFRDSLIPGLKAYSARPLRRLVSLLISNQVRAMSPEELQRAAVAAGLSSLRYK